MRGREKPDGKDWQDMTGYRVPPLKLTAYLQYKPDADWNNRLQATFFDSRTTVSTAWKASAGARSAPTPRSTWSASTASPPTTS